VDITATDYPGQLVIGIRHQDPSRALSTTRSPPRGHPRSHPRTPAGSPPGPPSATRSRSGSSPRPASP
jgi:hypothetical protein